MAMHPTQQKDPRIQAAYRTGVADALAELAERIEAGDGPTQLAAHIAHRQGSKPADDGTQAPVKAAARQRTTVKGTIRRGSRKYPAESFGGQVSYRDGKLRRIASAKVAATFEPDAA